MDAEVKLLLDNTDHLRKIDESDKANARYADRAQGYGAKIRNALGGAGRSPWDEFIEGAKKSDQQAQGLSHNIEKLFARDPGRRGEVALTGFISGLAEGDITGALESIASKISGIGLVAGVGFGAASVLAVKFTQNVIESNKALRELHTQLAIPESVVVNLPSEDIKKQIEGVRSSLESLEEKRRSLSGNILPSIFLPLAAVKSIQDFRSDLGQLQGGNRLTKDFEDLAKSEERITAIRRTRLTVSSEEADRLDAVLKKDQEIAKIEVEHAKFLEGLKDSKLPSALIEKLRKAEGKSVAKQKKDAEENLRLSLGQPGDVKDRGLQHEERLLALQGSGLTAEQQKAGVLVENLAYSQKELSLATDITKAKLAQLSVDKAKAAIAGAENDALAPERERAKFSFDELLKGNFRHSLNIGGEPTAYQDQLSAKEAQRLEGLGQQAKSRGDLDDALKFFLQADEEKSNIGSLKDSEKNPYFQLKNALAVTEDYLSQIAVAVAQPSRPVNR